MNVNIAKTNLRLMKSILEQHNITFWLAWGTCLGAIREQKFIAYDSDIDIECYQKDKKLVISLIPELESLGFIISPYSWSTPKKFERGIQLERQGIHIDIFWVDKINNQAWLTGLYEVIAEDFFSELHEIDFLSERYKVPNPPEEYLNYAYGSSWKKQIPGFPWNNQEYKTHLVSLEVHQQNLALIKAGFAKYNIPFWLADITCQHAVIGNHLDSVRKLSINTYDTNRLTVIRQLIPSLESVGFEVFAASYISGMNTIIYRQNEPIYIKYVCQTSWKEQLQKIRWRVGRNIFIEDFFSQLINTKYLGDNYLIPSKPNKYLDYLYGSVWQEPELGNLSEIELVNKIIQRENQIKISVQYPFLTYKHRDDNLLIFQGDQLVVSPLYKSLSKGTIVLVKNSEELLIRRVVDFSKDNQVHLSDEIFSQNNIWVEYADILGEAIALHSLRLGITIPLNTKVTNLMFNYIKPLLMRLKQIGSVVTTC